MFIPKGLKQGCYQGEPINYDDDDDEIDDNDNDDDDDDDADDNNNDGNYFFLFFINIFFCKNLGFEAPL